MRIANRMPPASPNAFWLKSRPGISVALGALLLALSLTSSEDVRAQHGPKGRASNLVYITTNDPTPGQNAVLAFRRNTNGCGLTPLGRFLTGGTGDGNPTGLLGTLDSDQNVIVSPDHRLLFAVNAGSDTVAVFQIDDDGSLTHAKGSPFPSGGRQPVSLGLADNLLVVINKNEDRSRGTAGAVPNYSVFHVSGSGHLNEVPHSTIDAAQGSSPSQALVSPDNRFLFDAQVFVDFPVNFPLSSGAGGGGTLQSFQIRHNGRLEQNPALRLPGPENAQPDPLGFLPISGTTNGALGLGTHPTLRILYVGFVARSQLGVYSWDQGSGELTFQGAASNSGLALCWIKVDPDGRYLYTSNTLSNTISRYNLSNPFVPFESDTLQLTLPSLVTQLDTNPSGSCLYAMAQRNSDAPGDPTENGLHIINTPATGPMTEAPGSPIRLGLSPFNLPATARPQGVAAF